MTPRSKRYLADKYFLRLFPKNKTIMQVMIEMTRPIPKHPPGTVHPGGSAIVGEGGPELMIHRSRFDMVGPPVIVPLPPSSCVIPNGLIDNRLLELRGEDLKRAVNEHTASDLVKKAIREAYGRLPDFARGNIKIKIDSHDRPGKV